ncbi:MAG TPA: hypothetical protein VH591_13105 [Ktedonobacterales bacterium]|jgi:hypothetical protein
MALEGWGQVFMSGQQPFDASPCQQKAFERSFDAILARVEAWLIY